MDVGAYLERIRFVGSTAPSAASLRALHRAHVLSVPFESLSIHCGEPITLDLEKIYRKIVKERRGGFCYENNGLFSWLLRQLGFQVTLCSARVRNSVTHRRSVHRRFRRGSDSSRGSWWMLALGTACGSRWRWRVGGRASRSLGRSGCAATALPAGGTWRRPRWRRPAVTGWTDSWIISHLMWRTIRAGECFTSSKQSHGNFWISQTCASTTRPLRALCLYVNLCAPFTRLKVGSPTWADISPAPPSFRHGIIESAGRAKPSVSFPMKRSPSC
ncbi:uncharacterized protein LOC144931600 isoform X2 [Lampetra fluviatilis]